MKPRIIIPQGSGLRDGISETINPKRRRWSGIGDDKVEDVLSEHWIERERVQEIEVLNKCARQGRDRITYSRPKSCGLRTNACDLSNAVSHKQEDHPKAVSEFAI